MEYVCLSVVSIGGRIVRMEYICLCLISIHGGRKVRIVYICDICVSNSVLGVFHMCSVVDTADYYVYVVI